MPATPTADELLKEFLIRRYQWDLLTLCKCRVGGVVGRNAIPNRQLEGLFYQTLRRNREKRQVGKAMQIVPRNRMAQPIAADRLPQDLGAFDLEQVGYPELDPRAGQKREERERQVG